MASISIKYAFEIFNYNLIHKIIFLENSPIQRRANNKTVVHLKNSFSNDKETLVNAINNNEDQQSISVVKPIKKVEFCKTEIHFAPDSGKVNIVETDGKPPPSNKFRRRRKNSSSSSSSSSSNNVQVLFFFFFCNILINESMRKIIIFRKIIYHWYTLVTLRTKNLYSEVKENKRKIWVIKKKLSTTNRRHR